MAGRAHPAINLATQFSCRITPAKLAANGLVHKAKLCAQLRSQAQLGNEMKMSINSLGVFYENVVIGAWGCRQFGKTGFPLDSMAIFG